MPTSTRESPALTSRARSDLTIARPHSRSSSGSISAVEPPCRGPPGLPSCTCSTSGSVALTGAASGMRPIARCEAAPSTAGEARDVEDEALGRGRDRPGADGCVACGDRAAGVGDGASNVRRRRSGLGNYDVRFGAVRTDCSCRCPEQESGNHERSDDRRKGARERSFHVVIPPCSNPSGWLHSALTFRGRALPIHTKSSMFARARLASA